MSDIPEVGWRFGERYLVTEFIQHQNVAVKEIANSLYNASNQDQFIEKVAEYIRDEYFYPLDNAGNPSASGQLLRHQKGLMSWHWKKCVYYMWSLPNEVMLIGAGICVDTGNLATSLLRAKELENTWACLGSVKSDEQLLGRHEWLECHYKGEPFVMETTIHDEGVNTLIKASEIYNKNSEWAKEHGLYYELEAKFNEKEYIGIGPFAYAMIQIMGLPMQAVETFGVDRALLIKPRKLVKIWRQEEIAKTEAILKAWRS